MKLSLIELLVMLCSIPNADGQSTPKTFRLRSQGLDSISTSPELSSNAVYPIVVNNGTVFLATNKGPNATTNGGKSFQTSWGADGPTDSSVSSFAFKGDTIAMPVAAPQIIFEGEPTDVGGGLYVSTDNGGTWTYSLQSQDSSVDTVIVFGKNSLKALPILTSVQNISYSAAFHKGYLYTANYGGGLRRTSDFGKTWERVVLPPDNLSYINQDSIYTFELSVQKNKQYNTSEGNYNQEAFSLFSDGDSALYVGTAGGIDKTTDNGASWYRFTHQSDPGISGNWVLWIRANNYGGKHYIWTVTRNATLASNDPTETSALSYTTDEGSSWHSILSGHSFHSLALNGSIVYGASDDGLFRTSDFGMSWQVTTNIYDPSTRQSNLSRVYTAVAVQSDTVWVGSYDGVAIGIDDGSGFVQEKWHVFRTYASVGNSSSTYFYPNPFSPILDVGRIHYYVKNSGSDVTIRIFDFSMHVVRTVIQNAPRQAGEADDQWNGRDDAGRLVDNGVYYYSLAASNQSPAWGKILVVR